MNTPVTNAPADAALAKYEENVIRQITQAEARIAEFETAARAKRLQAEATTIEAMKAARANIERQLVALSTKSDVEIAKAKDDIDAAALSLKNSLDAFGRKLAGLAARK